jgi:creatinine amidohydrolase
MTSFPSYRDRYLPAMTPARIAALPDKDWAPVIITTGAIEQHGPHLPVAVDALMGQAWLSLALPLLPPDASCYIAPPITIGKSNEHTGFPGTLTISKETLRSLLLASARQIAAWGFRQLAILNTHGGNLAVIAYTLREITATLGLHGGLLSAPVDSGLPEREALLGYHANTAETAWLLALAPEHVRPAEAVCEYPAGVDPRADLRPERAPATMAWVTADLSRSGVLGDATAATAEQGAVGLARGAQAYAAAIAEVGRRARAPR